MAANTPCTIFASYCSKCLSSTVRSKTPQKFKTSILKFWNPQMRAPTPKTSCWWQCTHGCRANPKKKPLWVPLNTWLSSHLKKSNGKLSLKWCHRCTNSLCGQRHPLRKYWTCKCSQISYSFTNTKRSLQSHWSWMRPKIWQCNTSSRT